MLCYFTQDIVSLSFSCVHVFLFLIHPTECDLDDFFLELHAFIPFSFFSFFLSSLIFIGWLLHENDKLENCLLINVHASIVEHALLAFVSIYLCMSLCFLVCMSMCLCLCLCVCVFVYVCVHLPIGIDFIPVRLVVPVYWCVSMPLSISMLDISQTVGPSVLSLSL